MDVATKPRTGKDLRKKPRRHFRYHARILTSKSGPPCSCEIADISETGARIVLEKDEELPVRFVLLLSTSGDARRVCRLIWRDGLTAGVAFPDGPI
jgi:hypothetical protein